jgi:LacI family transcriptional regulator
MAEGRAAGIDHEPAIGGPERRSTMRDVARASSVSVMTVSRVVNNSPNVDPVTRDRVLEAIATLGFRPNEAASSLRRAGAQTSTLGLVVDEVDNPFCSALHRGVERVCRARGQLLISGSSDRVPDEERMLVTALLRRRVDGLVLMASDPDSGYLTDEIRRGVQTVFADRRPASFEADLVTSDHLGAAREATSHLLAHGHRRVAFLGGATTVSSTHDRLAGYRAALTTAGLAVDDDVLVLDLVEPNQAEQELTRLISGPRPPTAVFAAQNVIAMGALRALHRLGLAGTVALVAFDDFDLADVVRPAVTVVAQNPGLIGETAAELLLSRRDGYTGPPRTVVVPAPLVVRGSGEIRGPG